MTSLEEVSNLLLSGRSFLVGDDGEKMKGLEQWIWTILTIVRGRSVELWFENDGVRGWPVNDRMC